MIERGKNRRLRTDSYLSLAPDQHVSDGRAYMAPLQWPGQGCRTRFGRRG